MNAENLDQLDLSLESPPFSVAIWKKLLNNEVSTYRCEALDHIPDEATDEEVAEAVIKALRDEEDLVRTCAADAARLLMGRQDIGDALRSLIKVETDNLTLAYAYASLGRWGEAQDIAAFTQALNTVSDMRTRLDIMGGFCVLLHGLYLSEMQALMKAKDNNLFYIAVSIFLHITDDESFIEKERLNSIERHFKALTPEELAADCNACEKLMKKLNERLNKSEPTTSP
ncbi:hypothetical protein [Methylovulum psychrotolerans]|uniref:HEAT repeat domain-containing protein n=1 Tax=Methylovulum psychrotolerans TaxID=1704499 RepID=A0A2S5CT70_9GAMM|nr:hypothetical protein [Methylovulum psychrotolerans]POZ53976.1 hypothetical protein AADEFJLK_01018 [Methylovulum psychrotolerans]